MCFDSRRSRKKTKKKNSNRTPPPIVLHVVAVSNTDLLRCLQQSAAGLHARNPPAPPPHTHTHKRTPSPIPAADRVKGRFTFAVVCHYFLALISVACLHFPIKSPATFLLPYGVRWKSRERRQLLILIVIFSFVGVQVLRNHPHPMK